MMNARLNKVMVALLAVAAAGACDDPPIEPGSSDAERLVTNPSFVVVEAGETRLVQAYLVNALGNPVSGDVEFEACNTNITVTADDEQTDIEPGNNFNIHGNVLGESCVNVSGGSFERTVNVRVVPAEVATTAFSDTVRAGDTGTIDVVLLDAEGNQVGPFAETDAEFESDNEDALFFTDEEGSFDTEESDNVTVTVTYTLFGVERTLEVPVAVIPGLPDNGYLADDEGEEADAFPGQLVGDTVSLAAFLVDTIGNINNLEADIDGITVTSSDESVVTAYAEITPINGLPGRVEMTIYAVGVGSGQATITATAHTIAGDIALGSASVSVVDEVSITSISPAGVAVGDEVTITGTNFVQPGVETVVLVDGYEMELTSITDTEITFDLLYPAGAGDIDITVDVGGGATTDTQTYDYAGEPNEPANNALALNAPIVAYPVDLTGYLGNGDEGDYQRFIPTSSGTLTLHADWDNADIDVDTYIYDITAGGYICTGSASGNKPEESTCTVTAGQEYILLVEDYSLSADGIETPIEYHVTATVAP